MAASAAPVPASERSASLDAPSRAVVFALVFVTGVFTGMDALRWWMRHGGAEPIVSTETLDGFERASHVLWYVRSILGAALLPLSARFAERADLRLQLGLFGLILVADWLIILEGQLVAGVSVFMLVQIGWAYRHTRGIGPRLRASTSSRRALVRVIIACALAWIAALALLGPPLAAAGLLVPLTVYSLLLCVSLIAAYSTLAVGHVARPRAVYIAAGMTFFVLCDITVGAGGALAGTPAGDAADASTGLFYGPSLVLLALSTREAP